MLARRLQLSLLALNLAAVLLAPGQEGAPPPVEESPPAADGEATDSEPDEEAEPTPLEQLAAARLQRAAALYEPDRGAAEVAWRAQLLRTADFLRAQAFERLPDGARLDLTWLRRWCETELILAERRSWRMDPSWHLRQLTRALAAVPPRDAELDAWVRYGEAIDAIPSALLAAQGELTWLREELVPHGIDASQALSRALGPTLADRAARAGLKGQALTKFGERCRRGRRAAEAFAAWLGTAEPSSVSSALLPSGSWEALAASAVGHPIDLAEIEQALTGAIAAAAPDAEAGDSAAPPASPIALPDATRLIETAATVGDNVASNLKMLGEPGPALSIRSSPIDLPIGPAFAARPAAGDTWEVALIPAGPDWPSAARENRERALGPERLAAGALVFGSPGQGWLATHGERGIPQLSAFEDPVGLDAWGLFAAHWLVDIGPAAQALKQRPGLDDNLARLRREAAARALASLELHARRQSVDEVRTKLMRHTGWDEWTADRELWAALSNPTRSMGVLVALEFDALWDQWTATMGREPALKRILGLVRRHPRARANDLKSLFD